MARDFEHDGKRTGEWKSKPAKRALECLFMEGELMTSRRVNFQKVYDLTERVLPEGWMAEAGARRTVNGETVEYGYMLWPLHGDSYAAIGIFGQFVFVDPAIGLVVAMWGAQPKPVGKEGVDEYVFLEALSRYFSPR